MLMIRDAFHVYASKKPLKTELLMLYSPMHLSGSPFRIGLVNRVLLTAQTSASQKLKLSSTGHRFLLSVPNLPSINTTHYLLIYVDIGRRRITGTCGR